MKYVFKKKLYLIIAFVLDLAGSILFIPARIFRRSIPAKLDKILVIRVDHIGDVISATSVLEPLWQSFPGSTIDLLAPSWVSGLLGNDPFIDNLIKFDPPWFERGGAGFAAQLNGIRCMSGLIRRGNYDLVIDLRGDLRHVVAAFAGGVKYRIGYGITGGGFLLTHQVPYEGMMHESERNMAALKPLGIKGDPPGIKLYFSEAGIREAGLLKKEAGIEGPYAVLHPVPGHSTKDWNASGFAKVARYIRDEKKLTPVMIGTAADKERVKDIVKHAGSGIKDLSGKTSLDVLGPVIKDAALFIGVDSGPSHIASAAGTPTVILFSGVNDPRQWAPTGDNVCVIYPGRGNDLSSVTPEQVFRAVDEALGGGVRAQRA